MVFTLATCLVTPATLPPSVPPPRLGVPNAVKIVIAGSTLCHCPRDWHLKGGQQITIYIYIENLGNPNNFLSFTICWGLAGHWAGLGWYHGGAADKIWGKNSIEHKLVWTFYSVEISEKYFLKGPINFFLLHLWFLRRPAGRGFYGNLRSLLLCVGGDLDPGSVNPVPTCLSACRLRHGPEAVICDQELEQKVSASRI